METVKTGMGKQNQYAHMTGYYPAKKNDDLLTRYNMDLSQKC